MQKDKIVRFSILLIIFLVCGCFYSCSDSEKTVVSLEAEKESGNIQSEELAEETKQDIAQENILIYVYICGEVKNPGVYQLEEGARLYQVVEMAGGVLESADENYLNLAASVTDGQQIIVPTKEEAKQLEETKEAVDSKLVNINTAGEDLLTTLPGIGSSKAKNIIAYRESKGDFLSVEDLMKIEGIKEGVFNKVKDMITVE